MMHTFQKRSGSTLIELLIFLAFFAVSSSVLLQFFILTSEQRIKQQVITNVDQTGIQLMQTITMRIRDSERISDPAATESGSILTLQLADSGLHPTVIGISGSILYVAEAETITAMTAETITVRDFVAINTSAAEDRPSVLITFTVAEAIPLGAQVEYARTFEALVPLFPDDRESVPCSCPVPQCTANLYTWQYCIDTTCTDSPVSLPCES